MKRSFLLSLLACLISAATFAKSHPPTHEKKISKATRLNGLIQKKVTKEIPKEWSCTTILLSCGAFGQLCGNFENPGDALNAAAFYERLICGKLHASC